MRKNSHTLILNALGSLGPLTIKQLKAAIKKEGVAARISEFNHYWPDIQIQSTDTKPKKYFLYFPSKVSMETKKLYPMMDVGVYKLKKKAKK